MRLFPIVAAALLCVAAAAPAFATTLTANSGWQSDETIAADEPSLYSAWDFTLTGNGIFSVTDCCVPGDIFTLSGGATGLSTYYAGSAADIQAEGAYGPFWTNGSFSKIAVALGAGTYSITITGNCGAGCPAGFGVRLDTATATVPEPAAWGLMIVGFGMVGATMRRRATAVAAA